MLTLEELLSYPEKEIISDLVVTPEAVIAIRFIDKKTNDLLGFFSIEAWMINPSYDGMDVEAIYDMFKVVYMFDVSNNKNMQILSSIVIAITSSEDPHDYV